MEMDMESMMGGDAGGKGGPTQGNVDIVVLSNIEQSCRALQQMGMILSKFIFIISDRFETLNVFQWWHFLYRFYFC